MLRIGGADLKKEIGKISFEVGDHVYGLTPEAQIPSEGAIIDSIFEGDPNYFHLVLLGGGGLGNRGAEEIYKKEDEIQSRFDIVDFG